MPFFKVAVVANRLVETFAHLENFLIIFQGPVIKIKQKAKAFLLEIMNKIRYFRNPNITGWL